MMRRSVSISGVASFAFSFVGTGSSFLAFAVFAAKRELATQARGRMSIYYLGGLTEGTETIGLFLLICLIPGPFNRIAAAEAFAHRNTEATVKPPEAPGSAPPPSLP